MSQNSLRLRFEIIQDGSVIDTLEIDQDVIKVGKLASSQLRLEDPGVSRIHAVIEKGPGGEYSVIDLGSAGGTFVNGEKITKVEISSGDELRFGDTLVMVSFVDAVEEEATQIMDGASARAELEQMHAAQTVTLEDGTVVEPYTQQGYYDEHQNYIPFWYDESGQANPGYGYYDEAGAWQVAFGYYDPQGDWVETDGPVGFGVSGAVEDTGPPASEIYQEEFFASSGGDTLEVAMLWAESVLMVNSYTEPTTVLIGATPECQFIVDESMIGQNEEFPLVVHAGGGFALTFRPEMSGVLNDGENEYTLEQAVQQGIARPSSTVSGAYEVQLGARTSARVDIGGTSFLVHFTEMPVLIGGGWAFDTDPIPYLVMSAVAHILFLLLILNIPAGADSLNLDGFSAQDRFVEMLLKPDQEEEDDTPNWLDKGGDDEEAAAKHKGDEGEAGKEDAPDEEGQMAIEGPPDNQDLELKKAQDTEVAMSAGVMKVFNADQVSSMWGNSDQSVGSDAMHAIGSLDSNAPPGTSQGFGGLGVSGAGRGGGGVSERGIGMANVGTAGRGGGGRGGGSKYGSGVSNLGEKSDRLPQVVPGNPVVTGSLDKEIIRRVIRRHRREVAYCYERELQKDKTLSGQVKVKFTISGNGSVIAAVVSESSLKNRTVESCVTDKIRRWAFPEPKGGGIVVVNYPFNFSRQ